MSNGSAQWLRVTPTAGQGTTQLVVSVDPAGLTAGQYTAQLVIAGSNALNSPQSIAVVLDFYARTATQAPFGYIDSPADGVTGIVGAVPFTGWALDDIEVTKVELWRDPFGAEPPTNPNGLVYIGVAMITAGQRPDVEAAYPTFPWRTEGRGGTDPDQLFAVRGERDVSVAAYVFDAEGHRSTWGPGALRRQCEGDEAVWDD